eukprot:SM000011S19069  [mRNA]  locus=s11:735548:742476:+ [translate_table: standard]
MRSLFRRLHLASAADDGACSSGASDASQSPPRSRDASPSPRGSPHWKLPAGAAEASSSSGALVPDVDLDTDMCSGRPPAAQADARESKADAREANGLCQTVRHSGGRADQEVNEEGTEAVSDFSSGGLQRQTPGIDDSRRGSGPGRPADSDDTSDLSMAVNLARQRDLEEEHFQLQLAMAISASNLVLSQESWESLEVEAAKRASLGFEDAVQADSAVDSSNRYWVHKVLNSNDRVVDGFYVIWGISPYGNAVGRMPSLAELQSLPLSSTITIEIVLVNRLTDPDLANLEAAASVLAANACKRAQVGSQGGHSTRGRIAEQLAICVAGHLGGAAVADSDLLPSWQASSWELKCRRRTLILPLGALRMGLVRHRALLFKVLADRVGLPCRLLRGRVYTGADEGAVNLILDEDNKEYFIDVMAAPGALIPVELTNLHIPPASPLLADMKNDNNTHQVRSSSRESSSTVAGQPAGPSLVDAALGRPHQVSNDFPVQAPSKAGGHEQRQDAGAVAAAVESPGISGQRTHMELEELPGTSGPEDAHAGGSLDLGRAYRGHEKACPLSPTPFQRRHDPNGQSQKQMAALREKSIQLQERELLPVPAASTSCMKYIDLNAQTADARTQQEPEATASQGPGSTKDPLAAIWRVENVAGTSDVHRGEVQEVALEGPGKLAASEIPVSPRLRDRKLDPVAGLGSAHPLETTPLSVASNGSSVALSSFTNSIATSTLSNLPVSAAAVAATAAMVASSMVAAAHNADITSLQVPITAAAMSTAVHVAGELSRQASELSNASDRRVSNENLLFGNDQNALRLRSLAPSDGSAKLPLSRLGSAAEVRGAELEAMHVRDVEETMKLDDLRNSKELQDDMQHASSERNFQRMLKETEEWEIPWEDIIIGDRIGLGSYGEVYRGDWHGSEVAVKKFLEQDVQGAALEEFRGEVAIMKRLRHPNVVLFMGAVTRPPHLSIVTEFLPRGSLYRLLHRQHANSTIDIARRLRMALDVAKGMNYLHSSNPPIVHRDLKSPNLLVDKNWVVKVCDFGLSKIKNHTFLTSKSTAGTPEWMAPEVLRNEPSNEKSDIFSFGVILWELATLEKPWGQLNPMQVVGAVGFQQRTLPLPDTVEPGIADIINACFKIEASERPSFTEIMAQLKPLQRPVPSRSADLQGQHQGPFFMIDALSCRRAEESSDVGQCTFVVEGVNSAPLVKRVNFAPLKESTKPQV